MSHNNAPTNTTHRISRVVPSKDLNIGLIIKHDLANIRKKVGNGIYIRYNDQRAPPKHWYLEAYLEESLDQAQNLLLQADNKYIKASQPRSRTKKPRDTPTPTHQNQFTALDTQKDTEKLEKKDFEQNFPSLSGPVPQPTAAPSVWVNPPKPKKIYKKTPSVDSTPRILPKPKALPIPKISHIKIIKPHDLEDCPDAWDNDDDWYDQIPGAH